MVKSPSLKIVAMTNIYIRMICTANQLTGFYMRATLALNELSDIFLPFSSNGIVISYFAQILKYYSSFEI